MPPMLFFAAVDAVALLGSMTASTFALSALVRVTAGAAIGADVSVEWARGGDMAELISRRGPAPRLARASVAAEAVGMHLLSHAGA